MLVIADYSLVFLYSLLLVFMKTRQLFYGCSIAYLAFSALPFSYGFGLAHEADLVLCVTKTMA